MEDRGAREFWWMGHSTSQALAVKMPPAKFPAISKRKRAGSRQHRCGTKSGGMSPSNVVSVQVYLTDVSTFPYEHRIYELLQKILGLPARQWLSQNWWAPGT